MVDSPRQISNSGSVTSPKIPLFSNPFSRPKKSEKLSPRPPKKDKNRYRNPLKTISMKSRYLQELPCENPDLEVPSVEMSIQKSICYFKLLEIKKLIYTCPTSSNRCETHVRPLCTMRRHAHPRIWSHSETKWN